MPEATSIILGEQFVILFPVAVSAYKYNFTKSDIIERVEYEEHSDRNAGTC